MENFDITMEAENVESVPYGEEQQEISDYSIEITKKYYVLKEREEGREERIRIKDLKAVLSMAEPAGNKSNPIGEKNLFIEVAGSFFPDFFEEGGIYFLSLTFFEYLKNKINIRGMEYRRIGLVSENRKRVEEYCLVMPQEVDCVLPDSRETAKTGEIVYFEIDDERTGVLEIFKVKGFPHLFVTEKLSRIGFAGFECTRIENYFDYEGIRDRNFKERLSGKRLEEVLREFENEARKLGKTDYIYGLRQFLNPEKIRRDVGEGINDILDSYNGIEFWIDELSERFFVFFWSWETGKVELAESHCVYFDQKEFYLKGMEDIKNYIARLPQQLKDFGKKVCVETILTCFSVQSKIFEKYENIHHGKRFRIYLAEEDFKSMNVPMVYDYKSKFQLDMEASKNIKGVDISEKDLREFDFSGRDLNGVTIKESNLRRAKFNGSILNGAVFINCDLTGAEFKKSSLKDAKFIDSKLDRSIFDGADMRGIQMTGCAVYHSSFVKSDMSGGMITGEDFSTAYFYKARLFETVFRILVAFKYNIFQLCDLRGAVFAGYDKEISSLMASCDFRNSDLSGSKFELDRILNCNYTKSKLHNVSFQGSSTIAGCNFKWSSCLGMNLEGVRVYRCDFTFVDLSKMKTMKETVFMENNFSYANLSRCSFNGDFRKNEMVYTDLSNCNFKACDLSTSKILFPDLQGAIFKEISFKKEQLEFVQLSPMQEKQVKIL
ncbi:MAG: pentapeptide repeat-containing protein [Clostridia bacterium]|nr:pentapeptide repeat-containing protein [Clostridia bacterium]